RCVSNLRQLGIATSLYAPDYGEKFPFIPFTGNRWGPMEFIDTWMLLNPYVPTNRSFYLCPVDRGPANFAYVYMWRQSVGIRTNDLPFPNSYWYWMAFFTKGKYLASLESKQRSLSEVGYPSQKVIMDCEALDPKAKDQLDVVNGGSLPQQHGRGR